MAIDGGSRVNLFARPGVPMTFTLDLLQRRFFVAQVAINMLDSLIDYDRDNAVAADIVFVDGVRTPTNVSGGDHWGAPGLISNVHVASTFGTGRFVTFRLRVMGPDESAAAEGMAVF
jgi:hypothetical protein